MPLSTKPGWVNWKKCLAREVILEDLRPDGPLYNRDHIPAEDIFPWYKQLPAFKDIVLDQFTVRLADHRAAASKERHLAIQQQQYFEHDHALYPKQDHNENGEPNFDASAAKELLKEDIKNNKHLTIYNTARKLQASRIEYEPFDHRVFYAHIRQEVKLQKYYHYLAVKREATRKGDKM